MLLKYVPCLLDCQIKCFHSIQLAECFPFFTLFLFLINIHISSRLPDYLQVGAHHCAKRFFLISSSTFRLMSGASAKFPSLLVEKKSLSFRCGGFIFPFGISMALFFFPHKLNVSKRI